MDLNDSLGREISEKFSEFHTKLGSTWAAIIFQNFSFKFGTHASRTRLKNLRSIYADGVGGVYATGDKRKGIAFQEFNGDLCLAINASGIDIRGIYVILLEYHSRKKALEKHILDGESELYSKGKVYLLARLFVDFVPSYVGLRRIGYSHDDLA